MLSNEFLKVVMKRSYYLPNSEEIGWQIIEEPVWKFP